VRRVGETFQYGVDIRLFQLVYDHVGIEVSDIEIGLIVTGGIAFEPIIVQAPFKGKLGHIRNLGLIANSAVVGGEHRGVLKKFVFVLLK
jgi:hypothetical protein